MRFKTEGPVVAPNVLQERRKHNSFAVPKTEGPALTQNVLQERRAKFSSQVSIGKFGRTITGLVEEIGKWRKENTRTLGRSME